MRLGRPRAATELMSPRLPKSASPIQIAEPLHREIESNKRYCDLVALTRDGENGFDIQRVEKKDSRFHGLTGELTEPGILIVAQLKVRRSFCSKSPSRCEVPR